MKTLILILTLATTAAAQLPPHVVEFLEFARPLADTIEARFGIPPAVTLTVCAFESGYARSDLAKKNKNFFGIKDAGGDWQQYRSAKHCFLHFGLILSLPRYDVLKTIPSDRPAAWFMALQLCGYCRSSNYAIKLTEVANYLNFL